MEIPTRMDDLGGGLFSETSHLGSWLGTLKLKDVPLSLDVSRDLKYILMFRAV